MCVPSVSLFFFGNNYGIGDCGKLVNESDAPDSHKSPRSFITSFGKMAHRAEMNGLNERQMEYENEPGHP
jgi:hypothetical protein